MKTLGSGVRQTLNYYDIAQCQLAVPQLKEQIEIANYIEKNTRIVEHAISLKEQEIEKLKEYKATLINSAVTGKIKVTNDVK
jgi:type I restriction enzyme S subunit